MISPMMKRCPQRIANRYQDDVEHERERTAYVAIGALALIALWLALMWSML